jgi:hypothetical protein
MKNEKQSKLDVFPQHIPSSTSPHAKKNKRKTEKWHFPAHFRSGASIRRTKTPAAAQSEAKYM